jgi:hypothetical protein
MWTFDDTVGLGVIGRDPDVVDTIFFRQDIEGLDIQSTIIGDNFFQWTPVAQDVFENEGGDCLRCLSPEGMQADIEHLA